MGVDGRDIRWKSDSSGKSWMTNDDGTWMRDSGGHRVPGPAQKIDDGSNFTTYDTSQGHCGLCGSLRCNGGCFK